MVRVGELAHKNTFILYSILSIRSISVTVTMKVSPSVIAKWVVLASSGGWVSVKNDDVEATVVASLCCTLLRLFSSGQKKPVVFHNLFIPAKVTMEQQGRNRF